MPSILAILQNQWFRDPDWAKRLLETRYRGRHEVFAYHMLFLGCLTGQRLRTAFGNLCEEIIWENASPQFGNRANAVFPPDCAHLHAVWDKFKPQVVLTFGRVAERAILKCNLYDRCPNLITGPHPTARGSGRVKELELMAVKLRALLEKCEG